MVTQPTAASILLMNMNLADRVRAEQVLELMGRDLDLAVEFLLAQ